MTQNNLDKNKKIELIKSYLNDLDLNLQTIINEGIDEMKEIASKTDKEDIDKLIQDLKNM